VVDCARRLRQEGLNYGTSGNVSGRSSEGFLITPSGLDYDAMSPADIVPVRLPDGTSSGARKPSSDTPQHVAIYRARPDVGAIVHTHSTYALVFAVLRRPIPPLLQEAAGYLGGEVGLAEYSPAASADFAQLAARGLGESRAVVLPNHGVLAVGEDLEKAYTAAVMVERSARIAFMALLAGEPQPVPADELRRVNRFLHTEYGQR
jgi:L-fuculose-phosphate aldolase